MLRLMCCCRLAFVALFVSGCANPSGPFIHPPVRDLDLVPIGEDIGEPPASDAGVSDLAAPTDLRRPPGGDLAAPADLRPSSGCSPVVNEVQAAGAGGATDELVELYNGCAADVALDGWKLEYRSAGNNSGGADSTLYTFPTGVTFTHGTYLVVAGAAYGGQKDATFSSGGLAESGGAVGLRDGQNTLVDSVAYQTLSTANTFTEGTPAPNPPTSMSIQRTPNGHDSDVNSADFQARAPTPRAAN